MTETHEEQNASPEELRQRIEYLEALLEVAIGLKTNPDRRKYLREYLTLSWPGFTFLTHHELPGIRVPPETVLYAIRESVRQQDEKINYVLEYLAELAEQLELQSVLKNARVRRIVPVTIYIAGEFLRYDPWLTAIDNVTDALDLGLFHALEPQYGSFFRKIFTRTNQALTQDEVVDRLRKVERALELKGIDGPQADVDLKLAKATRELAKAFESVEAAAALIGSLCVVKVDGKMMAVTLTQEQLAQVSANPDLLKNPLALRNAVFQSHPGTQVKRRIVVRKPPLPRANQQDIDQGHS